MNEEQKKALNLLKTANGQVAGIVSMLEEGRYCVDISTQIMAVMGLLKKANLLILDQHMQHCVTEAFKSGDGGEKIDEVIKLINRMTK